jgi:hypothetical protein
VPKLIIRRLLASADWIELSKKDRKYFAPEGIFQKILYSMSYDSRPLIVKEKNNQPSIHETAISVYVPNRSINALSRPILATTSGAVISTKEIVVHGAA